MIGPSVTTVLAPFTSFAGIPEHVLEHAANRGTKVHAHCTGIARGLWPGKIDLECEPYVASFRQWKSYVEEVVLTEERLFDDRFGFHGQIDLLVRMRGDSFLTMIDLKTPDALQLSWRVQLAAYKHLAEWNGYDVQRVASLRLSKAGRFPRLKEYTGTANADFGVFLSALNCWKFFNQEG